MANAVVIYPNPVTQDASGNVAITGNETVAGSLTVTGAVSASNFNISGLGAFDANAFTAAYVVDDLIAHSGPTSGQEHTFSQSGTSNIASLCMVTSSDNLNTNVAATDALQHPGCVGAATINTGYATATVGSGIKLAYSVGSGVTQRVEVLFRTPSALSDGTNTYTCYVGGLCFATGAAKPFKGFYLAYDTATSPNWQYGQITNAGVETMTTSSVPVAANTWSKLIITFAPSGASNNVTFVLDGVSLGSITVTANNLAGVSQAVFPLASISVGRTVSDTTSYRTAYMDRVSYYASGLSR